MQEHDTVLSGLRCMGFDEGIEVTRSFVDKGEKQPEIVNEDHYVIVSYPGNTNVDHVASQTRRSVDTA